MGSIASDNRGNSTLPVKGFTRKSVMQADWLLIHLTCCQVSDTFEAPAAIDRPCNPEWGSRVRPRESSRYLGAIKRHDRPVDDCTFYYTKTSTTQRRAKHGKTRIGYFKFAQCRTPQKGTEPVITHFVTERVPNNQKTIGGLMAQRFQMAPATQCHRAPRTYAVLKSGV